MINTLGLLEVYGFVAGVEAMDAMLKSANVRLLSHSVTPSALVTIVIEGDLAACRAALDAGCAATEYIGGKVLCQKVLGRPERDTERMVLSFCGSDSELHQDILQSYGVASKRAELPAESCQIDDGAMDISQQPELEIEVLDLEELSLEALTEEAIHRNEIEAAESAAVSHESSELPDDEDDLSQEEAEEAMIEATIAEAHLPHDESSIAQEVAETRNELAITELERMAHASIEQENENTADAFDLTDELLAEESIAGDNVANNEIAEAKDELEVERAAEEVEEAEAHAELAEVITGETTIWKAEAEAELKEHTNAVSESTDAVNQDDTEEQGEEENFEASGLDKVDLEALDLEELLEDIDIDFDPEMEEIFKLVASFLRDKGEKGSNLLEMSNRLGIDLAKLKRVLHRSVRQKLLRKNSNRYFINL